MIGLSVGVVSLRSLRQPIKRLVQRIVLFSVQNKVLAGAEGQGTLALHIAAPALHAGEYQVDPAALLNGPACLVLPEVSLTPEGAIAKSGLWACDPQLGPVELTGRWIFDANLDLAIQGLTLPLAEDYVGRTTRYEETAHQASRAIAASSSALTLPTMPVQEPEQPSPQTPSPVDPLPPVGNPAPDELTLKVNYINDGTFQLSVDPTETLSFTIEPPHIHAGTYILTPAQLEDLAAGPVCVVLPEIVLSQDGTQILVGRAGLWAYDSDLGEMTISRYWQKDGLVIADQITQSLPVDGNRGTNIQHVEQGIQPGLERQALSVAISVANLGGADMFNLADGSLLRLAVLDSGYEWQNPTNTNSIAVFQGNKIHARTSNGQRFHHRSDPGVSADHAAEVGMVISSNGTSNTRMGIGLRIQSWNTGYSIDHSGTSWFFRRVINGASTLIGSSIPAAYPHGSLIVAEGEAYTLSDGSGVLLRLYVNGALIGERIDTNAARLTTGKPGVTAYGTDSTFERHALTTYKQRNL